jgi:hypothetical protein
MSSWSFWLLARMKRRDIVEAESPNTSGTSAAVSA